MHGLYKGQGVSVLGKVQGLHVSCIYEDILSPSWPPQPQEGRPQSVHRVEYSCPEWADHPCYCGPPHGLQQDSAWQGRYHPPSMLSPQLEALESKVRAQAGLDKVRLHMATQATERQDPAYWQVSYRLCTALGWAPGAGTARLVLPRSTLWQCFLVGPKVERKVFLVFLSLVLLNYIMRVLQGVGQSITVAV